MGKKISELSHPDYDLKLSDWQKFRLTFEGGSRFVSKYLQQMAREDQVDFSARLTISPSPSHAKAAINDIKNAIFQRMVDITREGGPTSYLEAVNTDVDFTGNTMNGFIGRVILPELLSIGKVGVFVDKPPVDAGASLADTREVRPYLYEYHAEDIKSWAFDSNRRLISLLLVDHVDSEDEETGLVTETVKNYRLIKREDNGTVSVTFFDENSSQLSKSVINIPEIPFVIFELSSSLLIDVADYQIALLNANSSDISFILKSNFPFYTEQYSAFHDNFAKPVAQGTGTSEEGKESKGDEIVVGVTKGRRYSKDVERPGFIHPSPEPLIASMDKQREMKSDIRQLVNLALANIAPKGASAESKKMDERSLESGLSYIGLELEFGERRIAYFWTLYEGKDGNLPTIKYPEKYSLTSDSDTLSKADKLTELISKTPSLTLQKALARQVASLLVGPKITGQELEKIFNEINAAKVIVVDRDNIKIDIESGLVSAEFASLALGYPAGEAVKAQEERAIRAASIVKAQSSVIVPGVTDSSVAKEQKAGSQDHATNVDPGKAVHK